MNAAAAVALPGLVAIGAGVALVVAGRRPRRPARPAPTTWCDFGLAYSAHGVLPVELGGPDTPVSELPAILAAAAAPGIDHDDVRARVTRSCVSVYTGQSPNVRLVAVWRWSGLRGRLVPYDRRDLSWSPEWSRELAEHAWRESR